MQGIALACPDIFTAETAPVKYRLVSRRPEQAEQEQGGDLWGIPPVVKFPHCPEQEGEKKRVGIMLPGEAQGQFTGKGRGDITGIDRPQGEVSVFQIGFPKKKQAVPSRRSIIHLEKREFLELVDESFSASFRALGDGGSLSGIGTVKGDDLI